MVAGLREAHDAILKKMNGGRRREGVVRARGEWRRRRVGDAAARGEGGRVTVRGGGLVRERN